MLLIHTRAESCSPFSLEHSEPAPVLWKYSRSTSANSSQSVFGWRDYLSNAIWLFLALGPLVREVQNWPAVLKYYLLHASSPSIEIRFRNHDTLLAPRNYIFEAIAETLLVNSYHFQGPASVVVDVGASIGDFALLASREKGSRVYAFEKDSGYFHFLKRNMNMNGRHLVRSFEGATDRNTLKRIIDSPEERIDFLKIDCEGCEYEILLECPPDVLNKVMAINLEIHERPPYTKVSLIAHLKNNGFLVSETQAFGKGHRLYARRKSYETKIGVS